MTCNVLFGSVRGLNSITERPLLEAVEVVVSRVIRNPLAGRCDTIVVDRESCVNSLFKYFITILIPRLSPLTVISILIGKPGC